MSSFKITILNLRFIIGFVAIFTASACISTQQKTVTTDRPMALEHSPPMRVDDLIHNNFTRSKLIAADFASTLQQNPVFSAAKLVFRSNKPSTEFGKIFTQALRAAGFDLQWDDAQSSTDLVININEANKTIVSDNQRYTFFISVGEFEMKREYEVLVRGVKPMGRMLVRGIPMGERSSN